jgi:hypothetical protein
MQLPERTEARNWEGATVVDRDGDHLGQCVGVFADTDTGATEWLHVDVQGHRRCFVPALGATGEGDTVRVTFARAEVLAAPQVGDDLELSKGDEVVLYRHYDVKHTSTTTGSVLPTEADGDGDLTQDAPAQAAPTQAMRAAGVAAQPDIAPLGDPLLAPPPAPPLISPPVGSVPADLVVEEDPADPVAEPTPPVAAAPPVTVPPVAPRSTTSSDSSSSSSGSPFGPLAAVGAVIAAVAVVLRIRDARARKRRRPAARAARVGEQVRHGSASAVREAGKQLAIAEVVAARTSREVAAKAATVPPVVAARSKDVRKSAAGRSKQAKKSAAGRTEQVRKSAAGVGPMMDKRTRKSRKKARKTASSVPAVVAARTETARETVAAVPATVAKKGRRAKRSVTGTLWDLATIGAGGTGYVLGARAGRERYEQINQQAASIAASPQVETVLSKVVTDPERREKVLAAVQRSNGDASTTSPA